MGTDANVLALGVCLASNCETACGLECGAIADLISEPDAAATCEECLKTNACAKAEACASSEPCYAVVRDTVAFATFDTGELSEQLLCASSAASGFVFNIGGSAEACGKSADDRRGCSDVGDGYRLHIGLRDPLRERELLGVRRSCDLAFANAWTSTMHWQVKDYPGGAAPVGGVLVQVCSPGVPTCNPEVTHGTTDATGRVPLLVPNIPNPTSGLGLNGFVRVSSPNIVTTDQYWGFPLVEAQLVYNFSEVVTPTELQGFWEAAKVTQIRALAS